MNIIENKSIYSQEKITTYLASPWFSKYQMEIMNKVRNIILDYPEYKLFAPFYDGIVYDSKKDSEEVADKAYEWNMNHTSKCKLLVAIVDDFDPGTVFEMGVKEGYKLYATEHAFGYTSTTKILAYSDVPGRGLNLMLKKASSGFANGEKELREQLVNFKNGKPLFMPVFEKGKIE